MTTPAASRVLALVEILENILLRLPTRDLLLSQRVSRLWNSVIATSPALQEALCFRASKSSRDNDDDECYDEEDGDFLNPLIEAAFPFMFEDCDEYIEYESKSWRDRVIESKTVVDVDDGPWELRRFRFSEWQFNPAAWKRKEATWRRMQLTKEPLRRLALFELHTDNNDRSMRECILNLGECRETPNTTMTGATDLKEEQRGWMKVGGRPVDLTRLNGLPTGLAYDYIHQQLFQFDPAFHYTVTFHYNFSETKSPFMNDVALSKIHSELLGTHCFGDGLTMLIRVFWYKNSESGKNGMEYKEFTSDGNERIEVGPWVMAGSKYNNEDSNLHG